MAERKKILITGAAGVVGTALRQHLRDRYDYRLLFHSRVPEVGAAFERPAGWPPDPSHRSG
jgi:nucleoside-diphosphate-sugar epimerase